MNKLLMSVCLIAFFGVANANNELGFTGEYSVANWTQSLDENVLDISGAPNSIILYSSNSGANRTIYSDFTVQSLNDGLVSFSWDYITTDGDGASLDPFGWLINGVYNQLTDDNGSEQQNGILSFSVVKGDVFGFRAESADARFGSSETTISNFSVSPVSESSTLGLFALGLLILGLARRKSLFRGSL